MEDTWASGLLAEIQRIVDSGEFTEPQNEVNEQKGEQIVGKMTPWMLALYTLEQRVRREEDHARIDLGYASNEAEGKETALKKYGSIATRSKAISLLLMAEARAVSDSWDADYLDFRKENKVVSVPIEQA